MFFLNFVVVMSVATIQLVYDSLAKTGAAVFPEFNKASRDITTKLTPARVNNSVKSLLLRTDDYYQDFVSTHVDPILAGSAREKHFRVLGNGNKRELSPREMVTNRRFGIGFVALALVGVMYFTNLPILPLVIALSFYNYWPLCRDSYLLLIKEHTFSIVHTILIYVGWMWFSGQYIIAVIGGAAFVLFLKIRDITQMSARQQLTSLFDLQIQTVWVVKNGVELEISFEELCIGDVLVLDAGQMIPVDGVVIDGLAMVDQHRLTGEAQAIEMQTGDNVLAATLVLAGRLWVRVEKSGSDTAVAQIGQILDHTVDDIETSLVKEFEDVEHTLWPMLVAGLAGWMIAGPVAGVAMLGTNFVFNTVTYKMITFLNSLGLAANHGILIKTGSCLQTLNNLDVLVFDKTGTLTLAQPVLVRIHALAGYSEDEVLVIAATAEHKQTHPVALSILAAAQERQLKPNINDGSEYEIGYGIKLKIEGRSIVVGSARFMGMENITIPESIQPEIERCQRDGISLVYVAEDGELAGVLEMDACLREEAKEIVSWLKASGIKLYIISGDTEAPTRRLAHELGMDGYFAQILPEGKAAIVRELKENGRKVGFIGDGINDTIALREADVSVSFRSATNVASDNAQIVLMNDDLQQLKTLFYLARSLDRTLAINYSQAWLMSVVAGVSALLLPHKFVIVESFYIFDLIIGTTVATRPLLNKIPEDSTKIIRIERKTDVPQDGTIN